MCAGGCTTLATQGRDSFDVSLRDREIESKNQNAAAERSESNPWPFLVPLDVLQSGV
jgi:hypothetical protein